LGHPQPATPLRTDNYTSFGILNETIKQKRSKAMGMRYYWLTDRVRQKQFNVYWQPGRDNLGDYHTKHHSAQHHKDVWDLYNFVYNHCMRSAKERSREVSSKTGRSLGIDQKQTHPSPHNYHSRQVKNIIE
jgi:hypothetical protein